MLKREEMQVLCRNRQSTPRIYQILSHTICYIMSHMYVQFLEKKLRCLNDVEKGVVEIQWVSVLRLKLAMRGEHFLQ